MPIASSLRPLPDTVWNWEIWSGFKNGTISSNTWMHPFIGSYGFEDYTRLTKNFMVPEDVISRTPEELSIRVLHALDIGPIA
jgi:phosphoglycolate phosphatase